MAVLSAPSPKASYRPAHRRLTACHDIASLLSRDQLRYSIHSDKVGSSSNAAIMHRADTRSQDRSADETLPPVVLPLVPPFEEDEQRDRRGRAGDNNRDCSLERRICDAEVAAEGGRIVHDSTDAPKEDARGHDAAPGEAGLRPEKKEGAAEGDQGNKERETGPAVWTARIVISSVSKCSSLAIIETRAHRGLNRIYQ